MKVLIQDTESRKYLARQGGWTNNLNDADDFIVTTLAYYAAKQKTSGSFQVILHLPETDESIAFGEGIGHALATV